MLPSHQPSLYQPTSLRSNVSVKGKSAQAPSVRSETLWDVHRVQSAPVWYHLDRYAQVITGFSVHAIAQEIVKVNKVMGVHAEYDSINGTASLSTPDSVEIGINLFQDKKGGVVLDVKRQAGDSVFFHRYRRCILLAASGELEFSQIREMVQPEQSLPKFVRPREETKEDHVQEALSITAGLLQHEQHDSFDVGMEGLEVITDMNGSDGEAALMSSRAVLLEGNNLSESVIRAKVLEILQHWNAEVANDTKDHVTFMLNKALRVLSNCLDVMFSKGSKEELEFIYYSLQKEGVVECLIGILDDVHVRPHDAMLSVTSLLMLMKFCPKALPEASTDALKCSVEKANQYGMHRHADLARTCGALLQVL